MPCVPIKVFRNNAIITFIWRLLYDCCLLAIHYGIITLEVTDCITLYWDNVTGPMLDRFICTVREDTFLKYFLPVM